MYVAVIMVAMMAYTLIMMLQSGDHRRRKGSYTIAEVKDLENNWKCSRREQC
jgi:hypothetical protein